MTQNEERLNKLFEELVPDSGKADSLAGELVRATAKIRYRYFNDGDRIGVFYGNETCNAPARFLMEYCPSEVGNEIESMWGLCDDRLYEKELDLLTEMVVDYVESRPELRTMATDDMNDYSDPKEDKAFEEEDDEDKEWN